MMMRVGILLLLSLFLTQAFLQPVMCEYLCCGSDDANASEELDCCVHKHEKEKKQGNLSLCCHGQQSSPIPVPVSCPYHQELDEPALASAYVLSDFAPLPLFTLERIPLLTHDTKNKGIESFGLSINQRVRQIPTFLHYQVFLA